jgi:hypothetical protein
MRYVGYDELNPGRNFPKLTDSFEKEAYPGKNDVIHFLKNGTVDLARVSKAKDVFTGAFIPTEVLVMHNGDFCWSNTLAYYVEKYNLRLPKDFESHILSN